MKAIKIAQANAAAIESALKAANGKAHEHTYTTFPEIDYLAQQAEKTVRELLNVADLPGATWAETSGGSVAKAYKSMRNATRVTLVRKSTGWYLTDAQAVMIGTDGGGRGRLTLTAAQDVAAVAKLRKAYSVVVSA